MNQRLRAAAAVLLAMAGLVAMAAMSFWPWQVEPRSDGMVRVSWRARGEIVQRCHKATPEELSKVPAHMRQETLCDEGTVAPYRVRVVVGGATVMDSAAPGSGGRGDRPMYFLRDFRVAPGSYRLTVELARADRPGEEPDSGTIQATGSNRARTLRQRAIPRTLLLDTLITIGTRDVAVVTYDGEKRRLVLLRE
jgi:hypothetical protein